MKQFSAAHSILFALKKNEELYLCVDYQKLNDITIKNHESLSNIEELQNHLSEAMFFIKLNLKETYYLICMKAEEEWKTAF